MKTSKVNKASEIKMTPIKCGRCNRTLKNTKSIQAGYGPTCLKKVGGSALASAPTVTEKKVNLEELIEVVAISKGEGTETIEAVKEMMGLKEPVKSETPKIISLPAYSSNKQIKEALETGATVQMKQGSATIEYDPESLWLFG